MHQPKNIPKNGFVLRVLFKFDQFNIDDRQAFRGLGKTFT